MYYKLVDRIPVPIPPPLNPDDPTNIKDFSEAWSEKNRRVAATYLTKDVWISTIFLVLDHGYSGVPKLFE